MRTSEPFSIEVYLFLDFDFLSASCIDFFNFFFTLHAPYFLAHKQAEQINQ